MQELEKILGEQEINAIKQLKEDNEGCYRECEGACSNIKEGKCRCGDGLIIVAIEKMKNRINDDWIPLEERLPEEKKSVLVQWEKYDRHLNVTLTYLDVMWLDDAEEKVFETINGVPNGKVIAWRPLPEPYRPERSE